jgi:hypothetical protein
MLPSMNGTTSILDPEEAHEDIEEESYGEIRIRCA